MSTRCGSSGQVKIARSRSATLSQRTFRTRASAVLIEAGVRTLYAVDARSGTMYALYSVQGADLGLQFDVASKRAARCRDASSVFRHETSPPGVPALIRHCALLMSTAVRPFGRVANLVQEWPNVSWSPNGRFVAWYGMSGRQREAFSGLRRCGRWTVIVHPGKPICRNHIYAAGSTSCLRYGAAMAREY